MVSVTSYPLAIIDYEIDRAKRAPRRGRSWRAQRAAQRTTALRCVRVISFAFDRGAADAIYAIYDLSRFFCDLSDLNRDLNLF